MQIVYVIGPDNGPYKVGYTTGEIQKRLTALQVSHHSKLFVQALAYTADALQAESLIHRQLNDFRLNGEWFSCDLFAITAAMQSTGLTVNLFGEASPPEPVEEPDAIDPTTMDANAFLSWLDEMKRHPSYKAGELRCAELLGVRADAVAAFKHYGADLRTALACRALFHRLEPWA